MLGAPEVEHLDQRRVTERSHQRRLAFKARDGVGRCVALHEEQLERARGAAGQVSRAEDGAHSAATERRLDEIRPVDPAADPRPRRRSPPRARGSVASECRQRAQREDTLADRLGERTLGLGAGQTHRAPEVVEGAHAARHERRHELVQPRVLAQMDDREPRQARRDEAREPDAEAEHEDSGGERPRIVHGVAEADRAHHAPPEGE